RITRLDQIGLFSLQDLFDRPQVYQGAIMRCSRNEGGMNEINSRALAGDAFRFGSGHDEHMFVRGRALNVCDFCVHIALHPATQWRIELRQIANFHRRSSRAKKPLWLGARDPVEVTLRITRRDPSTVARGDGFTSPASLNIALLPWPRRSPLQQR